MQFDQLKRRQFITLRGGAAVVWPLAARAQQSDRVRRIGVLMIMQRTTIRCARTLGKDAPLGRAVQRTDAIVAILILSGPHHQYVRI